MTHSKQDLIDSIKDMEEVYHDADTPQSVKDSIKTSLDTAKKLLSELEAAEKPAATEHAQEEKPTAKEIVAAAHAGEKKVRKARVKIAKVKKEKKEKSHAAPMTKTQKRTLQQIVASAAKYAGYRGKSEGDLKRDAARKAKKPGSRTSKTGHKYREYRTNRTDVNTGAPHLAEGGPIGEGKNGYVAFYKGKKVEVMADSSYAAQQKAAAHFKAKKSYDVTVVLAEIEGKQVTHAPMFAKGGKITDPKNWLAAAKEYLKNAYDLEPNDMDLDIATAKEAIAAKENPREYIDGRAEKLDLYKREEFTYAMAVRTMKKFGYTYNSEDQFERGGTTAKTAKLVNFDSMYSGKVKAYESVSQKGLFFYVDERGNDTYAIIAEAKGYPASEAHDDWIGGYDSAMEVAKDMAEGKDVGGDGYAQGGAVASDQIEFASTKTKNLTGQGKAAFEKAIAELEKEDKETPYYKHARAAMASLLYSVDAVLAPIRSDAAPAAVHRVLMTIGILNYKTGLLLDTDWLAEELAERKLKYGGEIFHEFEEGGKIDKHSQVDNSPIARKNLHHVYDTYMDKRSGMMIGDKKDYDKGHYKKLEDMGLITVFKNPGAYSATITTKGIQYVDGGLAKGGKMAGGGGFNQYGEPYGFPEPEDDDFGEEPEEETEIEENQPDEPIDGEDIFIQDGRRGGYDVRAVGKPIGHFTEWDDAVNAIKKWREKEQYFPNTWYVTERGDANQLDGDGNYLKKGGRLKSALNRDRKYKSDEPWEQSYDRRTRPANPHYKAKGGEIPSHSKVTIDAERLNYQIKQATERGDAGALKYLKQIEKVSHQVGEFQGKVARKVGKVKFGSKSLTIPMDMIEPLEMARGGRTKHGTSGYSSSLVQMVNAKGGKVSKGRSRDRKFKSQEPWEQKYKRKTKPVNPHYKSSKKKALFASARSIVKSRKES